MSKVAFLNVKVHAVAMYADEKKLHSDLLEGDFEKEIVITLSVGVRIKDFITKGLKEALIPRILESPPMHRRRKSSFGRDGVDPRRTLRQKEEEIGERNDDAVHAQRVRRRRGDGHGEFGRGNDLQE